MAEECVFCKIVAGEIPSEQVYSDDRVVAFKDINPAAPVHVLIIPRRHIPTLNHLTGDDEGLAGHMITAAAKVAADMGVDQSGYRCVISTNKDAGQLVFHIHMHLLGGRNMGWPPG